MLQIEGALLNHKPFLEKTNVMGDELEDAWTVPNIGRDQFKKAMTPLLYGSSQSAKSLWKANKIEYTDDQATAFQREITLGYYNVANQFKEFIINNVQPKEEMTVNIWGEEFRIYCNRYRNVGDYSTSVDIYDPVKNRVKTIHHMHTSRVADLVQFKRYFVTLLVHNLDSRIADKIAMELDWGIMIYDAFITMPNDTMIVEDTYTGSLNDINRDRTKILNEYFKSIGIDSKAGAEWKELQANIIPVEEFKAQSTALK